MRCGGVICAMNDSSGDENNVAGLYVKGSVVDKVSAVAILHIVYLVVRVIVLGRFAVAAVYCLTVIKVFNFSADFLFHKSHLNAKDKYILSQNIKKIKEFRQKCYIF